MVLYEMLVGIPPWYKKGQDRETIFSRIVNEPPAFPRLLSEDAKDIISGFCRRTRRKDLVCEALTAEEKSCNTLSLVILTG